MTGFHGLTPMSCRSKHIVDMTKRAVRRVAKKLPTQQTTRTNLVAKLKALRSKTTKKGVESIR